MAGVKITNFYGIAPKVSPELLPETAAQIANNTKLYSGDLIPYPEPYIIGNTGRTGTIRTLYALKDPAGDNVWFSWTTDVDIAVVTSSDITDQRFYYTGDGVPKVTNYTLATTGSGSYPISYYDLGLPLPTDKPTITTVPFIAATTASYSRDDNNTATLTTATNHNLKDGAYVTITGFSYLSGTYTYVGTTVTCTITNHGLTGTPTVTLDFVSGDAIDGTYTATVTGANTFTVAVPVAPTATGDVRLSLQSFNATGTIATVTGPTTLEYFSPGPAIATTSSSAGKVNLGGPTQSRSYVYTWYTPWDEESIASDPTTDVFVKEGATVVVSGLPTEKPSGQNFVRGVRLYRTLATQAGTEYLRLKTLWFPTAVATVARTSNVSTVTLAYPHNLGIDDRFKIAGCSEATFDITDGVVTGIPDDYTFTFAQTAADVATTAATTGDMYHDIAENPDEDAARYWGDIVAATYAQSGTTITVTSVAHGLVSGQKITLDFTSGTAVDGTFAVTVTGVDTFTVTAAASLTTSGDVEYGKYWFTDDFDPLNLSDVLGSDEYDAPPDDMQGLIAGQNNILFGFVGNKLYISEPAKPHAWPQSYAITFQYDIVGLASINGTVLVLTEGYPFWVTGSDPAVMSVQRIDAMYPCVSKRGIVPLNYGVVWPTHDGMAVFNGGAAPSLVTKANFNNDTWSAQLDPSTIVGSFYGDAYLAGHSAGGFTFEPVEKIGGQFVTTPFDYTASWYDPIDGRLYYVSGLDGDIYQWDNLGQPSTTMEWKSKVIKTNNQLNLGAARVIADYGPGTDIWNDVDTLWEADPAIWSGLNNITFKLWVDKALIFTTTVTDTGTFRLPTGYRTDTFEVGVESDVRVRAIHLGETPISLKDA